MHPALQLHHNKTSFKCSNVKKQNFSNFLAMINDVSFPSSLASGIAGVKTLTHWKECFFWRWELEQLLFPHPALGIISDCIDHWYYHCHHCPPLTQQASKLIFSQICQSLDSINAILLNTDKKQKIFIRINFTQIIDPDGCMLSFQRIVKIFQQLPELFEQLSMFVQSWQNISQFTLWATHLHFQGYSPKLQTINLVKKCDLQLLSWVRGSNFLQFSIVMHFSPVC